MSHRADNWQHTVALAAVELKSEGLTNKQIAYRLGIAIERIPTMLLLGQRIKTKEEMK